MFLLWKQTKKRDKDIQTGGSKEIFEMNGLNMPVWFIPRGKVGLTPVKYGAFIDWNEIVLSVAVSVRFVSYANYIKSNESKSWKNRFEYADLIHAAWQQQLTPM